MLNLVNHIVLGLSGKLLSICEPIHTSKMGQYLKDIIIIIVTIVISTGCWLLHHHSDKSKTFYEDDNLPHSFVLRIKYQLCEKIYNSLTKYDEYCAWNPAGQVGKFSWELYSELVLYLLLQYLYLVVQIWWYLSVPVPIRYSNIIIRFLYYIKPCLYVFILYWAMPLIFQCQHE